MFRFLVITFGFSWGIWGVGLLAGGDMSDPLVEALQVAGLCGPGVAAGVLALTVRRAAGQAAGRRDGWRVRLFEAPRWLPAALLFGSVPAVGAAVSAPLAGEPGVDLGRITDVAATAGGWLPYLGLALLTGPLSEEFGWRGYLQPLLRRGLPAGRTAIVLGLIWAVWHVPLFFLAGTFQHSIGLFTIEGLGYLAVVVMLSPGLLYVSETLRGGVPAAVLGHLAVNVSIVLVPLVSFPVALIYLGLNAATALTAGALTRTSGSRVNPLPTSGARAGRLETARTFAHFRHRVRRPDVRPGHVARRTGAASSRERSTGSTPFGGLPHEQADAGAEAGGPVALTAHEECNAVW